MSPKKKILLLGANFGGNVGDLFIFESVINFVFENFKNITIDVYPYPLRNDSYVALPCVNQIKGNLIIREPIFRLRRFFDAKMRDFPLLEQLVVKNYYSLLSVPARVFGNFENVSEYDHIIVLGGEMDLPYSLLDVHSYIRASGKKINNVTYGPISIVTNSKYDYFLKQRFQEVAEVAVRDPLTLKKLQNINIQNTKLIPDCAFLAYKQSSKQVKATSKSQIGLCLHSRWGYSEELELYVQNVAIAAKNNDCALLLFVTNIREDSILVKRLMNMTRKMERVELALPTTVSALKEVYDSLKFVVSDRLHGILIGLINGCNILPLATRDKIQGYCEYLELDDYLKGNEDIDSLDVKFKNMIENSKSHHLKLNKFAELASKKVGNYYIESLKKSGF